MGKSELNRITQHIYWFSPDPTTDRPILGAIAGRRGALLVEAGNSPAHANLFLAELAKVNIAPPKFLALTHWHWDHVFGISAIDLPTFAHIETKQRVAHMAQLDWSDEALDQRVEAGLEIAFCRDMLKAELPDRAGLVIRPPDIAFTDQVELDLGGITCRLDHVGGDHAADSSVIYVPEERVVFLGDCFYLDLYHQPPRYTAQKLFPLLDRLLAYEADFYLASHDENPIPRAELEEYAAELKAIGQTVEKLGHNREAILAHLEETFGAPTNEDHRETVDAFLAGLKQ
jgi:glyoxylase-like metal-dependent hydrolase (beta-lactamase superfamily II)